MDYSDGDIPALLSIADRRYSDAHDSNHLASLPLARPRPVLRLFLPLALSGAVFAASAQDDLSMFVHRGLQTSYGLICGDTRRSQHPGPRDADDLATVKAGAEAGTASCALLLGNWSEFGQGLPQQFDEARRWYTVAAATNPAGYVALGRMAELGHGAPRDYAEARKQYTLAATRGYGPGELALGRLYEKGLGGPADPAAAADAYRKAAIHDAEDAWAPLDALQAQKLLVTTEQAGELHDFWNRLFLARVQEQIETGSALKVFKKDQQMLLKFSYRRGAGQPTVSVLTGSGAPAFDQTMVGVVSQLKMPAAPVFAGKTYDLNLPVSYVAGTVPAPTPAPAAAGSKDAAAAPQ